MSAGQDALPPPPRRSDGHQPPLTSQSSYPQLPGGPPPVETQATTSTFSFPSAPPPVTRTSTSSSPGPEGLPKNNIETVANYLNRKIGQGQALDAVEIAGVMALLKDEGAEDPDEEKHEPFRFSTSPSTRGNSPSLGALAASTSAPAANGDAKKPRMLTKNPNGVYRWQGAGSARPRNRYQSPGFGPSRSQPTIKIIPEKTETTDAKRRRVSEEAQESTSQHAPAPASATDGAPSTSADGADGSSSAPLAGNQKSPSPQPTASSSKSDGLAPPATPGLRTTGITTPNAPAVPSPLRNSWSNDPSFPSSAAPKPTRAATLVTDILKEVTPSEKKKDLINPYEAFYPGNLNQLPKKKPLKRKASSKGVEKKAGPLANAPGQKSEEKKQKEAEMSPSKIIEATVPKGAKRARPPPELEKQKPAALGQEPRKAEPLKPSERQTAPSGSSFLKIPSKKPAKPPVIIEELSDEDQPSPSKKAKTKTPTPAQPVATPPAPTFAAVLALAAASAKSPVPTRSISIEEVEEVEDQDMESVKPAQVIEPEENTRRSSSPTSPTTSAPGPFGAKSAFGTKSSAPKAPSKLRYSIQPEKDEQTQDIAERKESETPSEKSSSSYASTSAPFGAARPAKKYPIDVTEIMKFVKSLPKFELNAYPFDTPTSSPGAGPSTVKARDAAKATSVLELPAYSFDFTAAPTAAPSATPGFNWSGVSAENSTEAGDQWTCSTCMLKNPAAATEKCTICDAPRPSAELAAPVTKGFSWNAAGVKAPAGT
ncbi:uncharacterized protein PHACADRAFT_264405, partial [Phanerochaete carnosa HHB-10118-sp]